MADRVVRTSERGWGSRLGSSLKGIVVGLLLAGLGVALLFWGEGRAVRRAQALVEGAKTTVSVPAESRDPSLEGHLVHVAGGATSEAVLEDPELGQTSDGLKLSRHVEMYQWREHEESKTEKKLGGGEKTVTVYTYDLGWDDEEIDASRFEEPTGHENPPFPLHSETWVADPIQVGAFVLGSELTDQISFSRAIEPSEGYPSELAGLAVRATGGQLYVGADPSSPSLGDLRIRFEVVPEAEVSVVAAQRGDRLEPYVTSNKQTIALLSPGLVAAETMFQQAQAANATLTWLLRGGGFLLLLIGFAMVLRPLSVLADVVPMFGRLVGAGVGFVSFCLAAVVSLVTIAVGWIFYRPLLGLTLLAAALVVAIWVVKRLRRPASPPPIPPPLPPLPPG